MEIAQSNCTYFIGRLLITISPLKNGNVAPFLYLFLDCTNDFHIFNNLFFKQIFMISKPTDFLPSDILSSHGTSLGTEISDMKRCQFLLHKIMLSPKCRRQFF